MDYKELLNRCKTMPGWLGTSEQKVREAQIKYRGWVNELDRKYGYEPGQEPGQEPGKEPEKVGNEEQKGNKDFWSGNL